MSNTPIDHNIVQEAVDKRRQFKRGVYTHFAIFAVVNIIVWAAWALGPKDNSVPFIPIIITGAWAVVLICHAAFVFFSHQPSEVRRDEIKRQTTSTPYVDSTDSRK